MRKQMDKKQIAQQSILEIVEELRAKAAALKKEMGVERVECICALCGGTIPDDDEMWCPRCQEYSGEWIPVKRNKETQ
jgi:rubrerythrin